jgi:hypothetical protein
MKIEKMIEEAKKLTDPELEAVRAGKTMTLIEVLGEIEVTIRHLTSLYGNPELPADRKAEFERIIREAETRAMAILTILRNRQEQKI